MRDVVHVRARGLVMRRRWWWVAVAPALVGPCWVMLDAPHLVPYVAGVLLVLLVGSSVTTVVLSRRRGIRVAHALRPDAAELTALQDDLLGRLPSQDSAPVDTGPVAAQVELHGDPQGDLLPGYGDAPGECGGPGRRRRGTRA